MTPRQLAFTVNGRKVSLEIPGDRLLVDILRDDLGLKGTKRGCGTGDCGSCTVLVNGKPVNSCLTLGVQVEGLDVTTVEGLGSPEHLHPLQTAFVRTGAVQCGYCTPGMLLSAKALLDVNPTPSEEQIRWAISGNLCRCTGYTKIVQAVSLAALELRHELKKGS